MSLSNKLIEYRSSFPLIISPSGTNNAGRAFEIISENTGTDEPDWHGCEVVFPERKRLNELTVTAPMGYMLRSSDFEQYKKRIKRLRRERGCTTHLEIAQKCEDKFPQLFRVKCSNGRPTAERLSWGTGAWEILGDLDIVGSDLRNLHIAVLWPGFFDTGSFTTENCMSLVYCFKTGASVLGVWAFHAQGCYLIDAIEAVLQPLATGEIAFDKVLRWIKPSIICLSESVEDKHSQCVYATWDLALLAFNSLRHGDAPISMAHFKERFQNGSINLSKDLYKPVRTLLSTSPATFFRKGREADYASVFDLVFDSIQAVKKVHQSGPGSVKCTDQLKNHLREHFVAWHLAVRKVTDTQSPDSIDAAIDRLVTSKMISRSSTRADAIAEAFRAKNDAAFWSIMCEPLFSHASAWLGQPTEEQKTAYRTEARRLIFVE